MFEIKELREKRKMNTDNNTTDKPLKVRFAPSPTGYLHIGGARTALFNYLYARQMGGIFLLRIEDTDIKREKTDSIEKITDDMKWLGMDWDEGPVRQTSRLNIYKKYADQILEKGMAYKCYCTPDELDVKRQWMMDHGMTPRYDGTCRSLTPEQQEEKEAQGRKPCLRFRAPEESVTVDDLVRGEVVYERDFVGDFVIMKSDGTPSYNFAVVVDDYEMGVTLVMRGEEHLVNTPRQIVLYRALGFELPQFAHISMILSPDRKKMSKRHGTVAVDKFRKQGFLPEALINYISLLGWSPPGNEEFFTIKDLVNEFSIDRIAKNPAIYDVEKLKWMNGRYISKMENEKLLKLVTPYLKEAGYVTDETIEKEKDTLLKIVGAVKVRLVLLKDIVKETRIFFDDTIKFDSAAKKSLAWETTPPVFKAFLEVLDDYEEVNKENYMNLVKQIQKKSGVKGKKFYMPLRVGITGQSSGIDMSHILTILTPEQMKARLKEAIEQLPEPGTETESETE